MASIITTDGSPAEKAAELINSHFSRTFSIGSDWNKIRVALRIGSSYDPGASLTGTPRFFIGLSHGTSSVYGDTAVSNSVGALTSTATWARSVGTVPYMDSINFLFAAATGSVTASFGSTAGWTLPLTSSNRALLFVDFERNTGNTYFSCSIFRRNTINSLNDPTQTQFFFYGEQESPSFTGHLYSQNIAYVPIDESGNGAFDSVNVSWNRTVPRIQVYDIAVYRFS